MKHFFKIKNLKTGKLFYGTQRGWLMFSDNGKAYYDVEQARHFFMDAFSKMPLGQMQDKQVANIKNYVIVTYSVAEVGFEQV